MRIPHTLTFRFLTLLVLAATPGYVTAQAKQDLPAELAVVPGDAFAFVQLRPADLWQSEPAARFRKMFPDAADEMLKALGEDPLETESFTVVFPTPDAAAMIMPRFVDILAGHGQAALANANIAFIETTVKPFNQSQLLERVLGKGAVANKHRTKIFYTAKPPAPFLAGAVHLVNDRTYMFTFADEAMRKTLDDMDRPNAKAPLAPALELARQKRHLVFGLNADGPDAAKLRKTLAEGALSAGRGEQGPVAALRPLLEMRAAALALDVGKDQIRLEADMTFPVAQHAAKAAGAAQDALALLRLFAGGTIRAENRREMQRQHNETLLRLLAFADLLQGQLESALGKAAIEERQSGIKVQAVARLDMEAMHESAKVQARASSEDFACIHVRVADVWRTEAAKSIRMLFPQIESQMDSEVPFKELPAMGLLPDNVESVSIVLHTARSLGFFPGGRALDRPLEKRAIEEVEELRRFEQLKLKDEQLKLKDELELRKELELKLKKESEKEKDKQKFDGKRPEQSDQSNDVKPGRDEKFQGVVFNGQKAEPFIQKRQFDSDLVFVDDFAMESAVLLIVKTVKPYDRGKVLKGIIQAEAAEKRHKGKSYFTRKVSTKNFEDRDRFDQSPAVQFVDEHTFLVAPSFWMPNVLDRSALFQASDALTAAVDSAQKKKHHLVIGVNLNERSMQEAKKQITEELRRERGGPAFVKDLLPLLDARSVVLAADVGKEVRVQADIVFANGEQAAGCLPALQDGLTLWRLFVMAEARAEIRRAVRGQILDNQDDGPLLFGRTVLIPGEKPVLIPQRDIGPLLFLNAFMRQAETVLRKATVEKHEATLRVQLQGRLDVAALDAEARDEAAAMIKSEEAERHANKSIKNLRNLMQAVHLYHDNHKKLPASDRLSWRVHILPFMDELALYQEFKLNEPWDSPHNIKLLPRMPKVFAPPGIKTKEPFHTHYQIFTGPDTAFDPKFVPADRAIGIVEAFDAVPWTKPADLAYDAKKPLPRLGGLFPRGFHFVALNGQVEFFVLPKNEMNFRARIVSKDLNEKLQEKFDK